MLEWNRFVVLSYSSINHKKESWRGASTDQVTYNSSRHTNVRNMGIAAKYLQTIFQSLFKILNHLTTLSREGTTTNALLRILRVLKKGGTLHTHSENTLRFLGKKFLKLKSQQKFFPPCQ